MPTNEERQRHRLAALADFVADIDDLSDGELDEELRLAGLDPGKAVARVLSNVRQATWLDTAKAKRASTIDPGARARRRAADLDRQDLLQLIGRQGPGISAQFRKNEGEMSDEDLRELVVHLGLLDGK